MDEVLIPPTESKLACVQVCVQVHARACVRAFAHDSSS